MIVARIVASSVVAGSVAAGVAAHGSVVAGAVALVLALAVALVALPSRPTLGHVTVLLLATATLLAAGVDALPVIGFTAPFTAQSAHGGALLVLRIALLAVTLGSLRSVGQGAAMGIGGGVIAAFIASLAFAGALVPFAALCLAALGRQPNDPLGFPAKLEASGNPALRALVIAVLGAIAPLAARFGSVRPEVPPAPPTLSARTETVRWLERDNLFRAHFAAAAWAHAELGAPGEGTLVLAELDWALGHQGDALRGASEVAARHISPDVAAKAERLLAEWAKAPSR